VGRQETVIAAVRASSVADVAGAVPGDARGNGQGTPVELAVRKLLQAAAGADPGADWALRPPVAGRGQARSPSKGRTSRAARATWRSSSQDVPPGATAHRRRIGEDRGARLHRLRNLGDAARRQHFDAACSTERRADSSSTCAETQSGSPEVAARLLGRFVTAETPWIVRAPRRALREIGGAVSPAGRSPIPGTLVLVDRWTAGEGSRSPSAPESAARRRWWARKWPESSRDGRELRLPRDRLRYPRPASSSANGTPRESSARRCPWTSSAPSGRPRPILYQASS
jgi:hypothetical protein